MVRSSKAVQSGSDSLTSRLGASVQSGLGALLKGGVAATALAGIVGTGVGCASSNYVSPRTEAIRNGPDTPVYGTIVRDDGCYRKVGEKSYGIQSHIESNQAPNEPRYTVPVLVKAECPPEN